MLHFSAWPRVLGSSMKDGVWCFILFSSGVIFKVGLQVLVESRFGAGYTSALPLSHMQDLELLRSRPRAHGHSQVHLSRSCCQDSWGPEGYSRTWSVSGNKLPLGHSHTSVEKRTLDGVHFKQRISLGYQLQEASE